MIDKTTLHSGKDCWTTPRSSPPPCHVGALVQMIGDDTVDDEDEDYDGDDDNNHIEKERQAKVFTIALRYESSTLILYKELSSSIFQSCQSVRHR